jgi:hypothetical protein
MSIQMDALQLPPDSGTKQFFDWIGGRCIWAGSSARRCEPRKAKA